MPDLLEHVAEIDSVLRGKDVNCPASDEDRGRVRKALQAIAGVAEEADLPLGETITIAVRGCVSDARRTLATVMIRLVSSNGVLTEIDVQSCRREIVNLVEEACPDLTKGIFDSNAQNHEKVEALKQIHHSARIRLDELVQPFASLQDLATRRQAIMSSVKNGKLKGYLAAFGYASVQQLVESLLSQVDSVIEARGYRLQMTLEQLVEDVPIQLENCQRIGTFVTAEYAIPLWSASMRRQWR